MQRLCAARALQAWLDAQHAPTPVSHSTQPVAANSTVSPQPAAASNQRGTGLHPLGASPGPATPTILERLVTRIMVVEDSEPGAEALGVFDTAAQALECVKPCRNACCT